MSLEKKILICSSKTNPKTLAVAIKKELKKNKKIFIDAIGASAVNQAVKSLCYLNSEVFKSNKLSRDNLPVYALPIFTYHQVDTDKVIVTTRLEVR